MFVEVVAEIEAMTSDDALAALRDEVLVQRRTEARIAALVRKLDSDRAHVADGHASIRGLLRAEFRASEGDITHTLRCGRLTASCAAARAVRHTVSGTPWRDA